MRGESCCTLHLTVASDGFADSLQTVKKACQKQKSWAHMPFTCPDVRHAPGPLNSLVSCFLLVSKHALLGVQLADISSTWTRLLSILTHTIMKRAYKYVRYRLQQCHSEKGCCKCHTAVSMPKLWDLGFRVFCTPHPCGTAQCYFSLALFNNPDCMHPHLAFWLESEVCCQSSQSTG